MIWNDGIVGIGPLWISSTPRVESVSSKAQALGTHLALQGRGGSLQKLLHTGGSFAGRAVDGHMLKRNGGRDEAPKYLSPLDWWFLYFLSGLKLPWNVHIDWISLFFLPLTSHVNVSLDTWHSAMACFLSEIWSRNCSLFKTTTKTDSLMRFSHTEMLIIVQHSYQSQIRLAQVYTLSIK